MVFSYFITFLENLTKKINCKDVYYCLPHERLSGGLRYNESIFDWIEEENPGKYDLVVENEDEVDDSTFSDVILNDHEEDEVVSSRKPLDDSFLNALCPKKKSEDGSDTDATNEEVDVKPMYPIHDPNQNWKKIVPMLGMKFYDPDELKCLLSNYAVRHVYGLWYKKVIRTGC
ncbi:unnamed protein product [Lactuca saligna]|uniref:Uncharacterized protein n=1 Tax=Lactuca saligna TaxID=75948 RepID=A0AA35YSX0_LACSI|nr:unnamed protein product [Lactuca saligna]